MGCCFSSNKVEKSRLIIHAQNGGPPAASPTDVAPPKPLPSPTSSHVPPPSNPSPRSPATTATGRAALPPNRTANNRPPSTPGTALPSIETLTRDIGSKWAKPTQTLPIASDFPRLAKLTTIYVGTDKRDVTHQIPPEPSDDSLPPSPSPSPPGTQSVEQALYGALLTLSIHLHDPLTLQSTKQHFWDYHKADIEGEVARNFGLFLKTYLSDEANNVLCVLKSINQAILAPAIIALKMAISALPFKDYRNSWKVKVFISNDESVDVVHVRREQSFSTTSSQQNEEMKFEFVWELRIRLSLAGSSSSAAPNPNPNSVADKYVENVSLEIVEIAFGPGVPPQNKEKILGDMRKLTSSNCVVTTMPA